MSKKQILTGRRLYVWMLFGAVILLVADFSLHPSQIARAQQAPSMSSSSLPTSPILPPPAQMRIFVTSAEMNGKTLLNSAEAIWDRATATNVILNRTPRVYQTESTQPRKPPTLEVRGVRSGEKLYLRLQWDDVTKNAPQAPEKKTGEGGSAEQLYKQPTGETAAFADAAAVMMPEQWSGGGFPSVVMGDESSPAQIFYWNASRGTQILRSMGRATQKPTGQTFNHQATYSDGKWIVVAELPDRADGTPMAFAVWDGQYQDRDGLKFFSVWYALGRK